MLFNSIDFFISLPIVFTLYWLIAFSFLGLFIYKTRLQSKRELLLWCRIIVNLGFLGFFKYYNFFVDSLVSSFTFFGTELILNTLKIILAVGISFYTFLTLNYTIDVYNNKLKTTKDFVSSLPQLISSLIERAINLLSQFYKECSFKYANAVDRMRQILWRLFKKIVIAGKTLEFHPNSNQEFINQCEISGFNVIILESSNNIT